MTWNEGRCERMVSAYLLMENEPCIMVMSCIPILDVMEWNARDIFSRGAEYNIL